MNVQYEDVASASLQMQCCRVKRPESLGIHHADGFAHGERPNYADPLAVNSMWIYGNPPLYCAVMGMNPSEI